MVRVRQIMSGEGEFLEAAKVSEIGKGRMRSVKLKGIDVLIANVDGRFYALDDRCGHMNALLSMGTLKGKIVTCPFHFAEFDVTTGEKIKDPKPESFENIGELPEEMQKFLVYAQKLVDPVQTYDVQTHEVRVEKDKILVRL
jgi:nitrite reductase/ring-hydroxylating ferredoxin subunit